MRLTESMLADEWQIDLLDLEGYLTRLGVPAREPGRAALAELHEAHLRAFTFDNIDVLLGQHPGVSLDDVQQKFVGRGRGGYCFEHATIFAAVLERLGYQVRRHLGRVGDPDAGTQQARTHMVVEVIDEGERLLCDPGFGMSLLRPISMTDGAHDDYLPGWGYRVRRTPPGTGRWTACVKTAGRSPTSPTSTRSDRSTSSWRHHYTSTYPTSHFSSTLILAKHLPGRHVTVTHDSLTIRTPGEPTDSSTVTRRRDHRMAFRARSPADLRRTHQAAREAANANRPLNPSAV